MIKKSSVYLISSLICIILVGCATMTPPKPLLLAPDFEQRKPLHIAVLPVEDVRLVKQKEKPELEGAIAKGLYIRGYEVADPKQTKDQLQKSNITGDVVYNANPKELCNILSVDAVLKSRLHDYESSYKGLYRTDRLEMHFWVLDGKTGEVLWENRFVKHKTYVGGLLGSIGGQIKGWIEVEAFNSLPAGKAWSQGRTIRWF